MLKAATIFTGEPCKHGHVSPRTANDRRECIECRTIRDAARRVREREERAARERARYAADPEKMRERSREAARRHRERHGEVRKEYVRQWCEDNREQSNGIKAKYRKLHPEQGRLDAQRRRCRLAGVEGTYTLDDIVDITKRQKSKCACCRKKRALTIDHIKPISKGGSNWPSNLQMLCKPCNSRKHAKDPVAFMQEMGALL